MSVTDLQTWANEHVPDDNLIYKEGFWSQIIFVRDRLSSLFYSSYEEKKENLVQVVSEHTSKSVHLPVYRIEANGLTVWLRYNFYNWVVSVKALAPVDNVFMGLIQEDGEEIPDYYAEGFEEKYLFPPYKDGAPEFTIYLYDNYELWAFVYMLTRSLKVEVFAQIMPVTHQAFLDSGRVAP